MEIAYGENISYEPEKTDFLQLQKMAVSIALRLLKESNQGKGMLTLETPKDVHLEYDLNDGDVSVKSRIGEVNNTFSPDLEKQITKPVREAISLIARFELLKHLAEIGNEAIKTIIHKNHPNLDDVEKNLNGINVTLAAINLTRRSSSLLAGLSLFSAKTNQANQLSNVDKAITELINNTIHCKQDVARILDIQQPGVNKAAPSGRL